MEYFLSLVTYQLDKLPGKNIVSFVFINWINCRKVNKKKESEIEVKQKTDYETISITALIYEENQSNS